MTYRKCSCFTLVGRHLAKRGIDSERHNIRQKKKIDPSICSSASLCVSFLLLSIAPVDPCALSFSSLLTPTCSQSLVAPAPAFISHLPLNLLQWVWAGEGRKGRIEGRQIYLSAGMGLDNYRAYFCAPDKRNSTSAAKPNNSVFIYLTVSVGGELVTWLIETNLFVPHVKQ